MKEKELTIISIKDDIIVVEGQHSYQFLEEIKFGKEINGIVIKANYYRAYVALVGKSTQESIKVGGKAFATASACSWCSIKLKILLLISYFWAVK